MKKKISICFLLVLCFLTGSTFTQTYNPYGFTCELPSDEPEINQSIIGGQHKPESIIRYTNDPLAVFRVLVVFVQFPTDPGPEVEYWPINEAPTFIDNVVSEYKNTNYGTSWWDAYSESNAPLSDYWMEVSRGHFHVVGKTVNVILPERYEYYQGFGSRGIEKINDDIYAILQQDPNIYWPDYDLWSKNGNGFSYTPDGKVDMIYKVHRSHSPLMGMPAGGIAYLYNSYSQGANYKIYDNGLGTEIYINGGFYSDGSGLTITPGHGYAENDPNYFRYAPINKMGVVSFSEHEHGHYLFGDGHQKYGKMMGLFNEYGYDEFLSPYESIRMGYLNSKTTVYNQTNSIGDFTSRDGNAEGQVLEVPIDGSNEFFLIANRQKVSAYDKIMWGDTAHGDPYRALINGESPNYGKGIYIYHAYPNSSGYPYGTYFDNECADGLWNWEFSGYQHPDWSGEQDVDYFTRSSADYTHNDNGGDGGLNYHDGKSIYNWFGIGKREYPLYQYGDGTDRIFTNATEVWTSREWQGDRWDGWRVGYNEVFSPYSSPSTVDWNNSQTGIFIYLESMSGNTANLKIYRVGQGGWDLNAILAATPPSKPMLYRPVEIANCNGYYGHPKITWDNNLEPDMETMGLTGPFKKYRIYRAISSWDNIPPLTYSYYDTYDDYTPGDTASYIDNNVNIDCNPFDLIYDTHGYYRYKIVAVDNSNTLSVMSDFASTQGWYQTSGDRPGNNESPLEFALKQNFPNPFNPSTQIKFDLPQNTFVTVKVYNTIGEEVAKLVNNEFKSAGSYSVTFDGSNFGSGIYFYSIEAGQYKETKKMVLIK